MTTEGPLSKISGPYFDLVCAGSSRRDTGTACLCAETAHSTLVVQKQRGVFMTKLLLPIGMSLALSGAALAQQNSTKEQIVGAWSLVSVISETEDGKRGEPFGSAPKGVMIFSSAGHFSLFQSRADRKSQPMIARRQPPKKLRRSSHLPSPTTVRNRSTRPAR